MLRKWSHILFLVIGMFYLGYAAQWALMEGFTWYEWIMLLTPIMLFIAAAIWDMWRTLKKD